MKNPLSRRTRPHGHGYTGLLVFFLTTFQQLHSQGVHSPMAAPWLGQGAGSHRFQDPFSFTVNQAALAGTRHCAAALYGERRFLLKELSLYRFAFMLPVGNNGAGLMLNRYGYANFNESVAGLAYGIHLGKAAIGIQLNYLGRQVVGYGQDATAYAEGGAIWHAGNRLHIGFQVFNPYGGRFRKNRDEKLASVYTTSLCYEFSESFMLHASVQKEENIPAGLLAGFQYRYLGQLFVSGGISTGINAPYLSCGWRWQQWRMDLTAAWHLQLGISSGLTVIYNLNNPEKDTDE